MDPGSEKGGGEGVFLLTFKTNELVDPTTAGKRLKQQRP